MEINKEIIQRVAKVSRLNLSSDEVDKFVPQLKEILESFSKLDEVDTTDTKMSIQPVEVKNALREDVATESLSVEDALKNTQHKKDNYFKGPRAI